MEKNGLKYQKHSFKYFIFKVNIYRDVSRESPFLKDHTLIIIVLTEMSHDAEMIV